VWTSLFGNTGGMTSTKSTSGGRHRPQTSERAENETEGMTPTSNMQTGQNIKQKDDISQSHQKNIKILKIQKTQKTENEEKEKIVDGGSIGTDNVVKSGSGKSQVSEHGSANRTARNSPNNNPSDGVTINNANANGSEDTVCSGLSGVAQLETNPVDQPRDETITDDKKNVSDGEQTSEYKDAQAAYSEALESLDPHTQTSRTSLFVAPDFEPGRVPTLYTLANLGALLVDMPLTGVLDETEHGQGTTFRISYRWSDGHATRDVRETLLSEELQATFFSKEEYSALYSSTPLMMYECDVEPQFLEALTTPTDRVKMVKTINAMFGGRDDHAAYQLLTGYGSLVNAGDNHLAILMNMCRYYISTLCGEAYSVKPDMSRKSGRRHFVHAPDAMTLMTNLVDSDAPVVSHLDNPDYLHFMVTVSQAGKSRYPHKLEDRKTTDIYSKIDFQWQKEMTVVSQFHHNLRGYEPKWPENKYLIKGYIENYARKVGLVQQLSEAFKMTFILPHLLQRGYILTIPEPVHTSDLFHFFMVQHPKPTILSDFVDYAPFRGLLGASMSESLIEEAINTFVEGALYDRDRREPGPGVVNRLINMLNATWSRSQYAMINLVSNITGMDYSFLRHLNGAMALFERALDRVATRHASTLYKLLIARPVLGSAAWAIRHGQVMVSENIQSYTSRIPYELAWTLKHLKFDSDDTLITNTWDDILWRDCTRLDLRLSAKKRLHYFCLKEKTCRLYLEMIDFSNRPTFTLEEVDGSVQDIIAKHLSLIRSMRAVGTQATKIVKDKKADQGEDEGTEVVKTVSIKPTSVTLRMPEYLKKKYDETYYASLSEGDRAKVTASELPARQQVKEAAANQIYMQNEYDNRAADAYIKANEWDIIPNAGGGECGPLSCWQAITNIDQESWGYLRPKDIRHDVNIRLRVDVIEGEWWSEAEWTAAGAWLGHPVLMQVWNGPEHIENIMLYNGEDWESEPIVIRCSMNRHFEWMKRVGSEKSRLTTSKVKIQSQDRERVGTATNAMEILATQAAASVGSQSRKQEKAGAPKTRNSGILKAARALFKSKYSANEVHWLKSAYRIVTDVSKQGIDVDFRLFLRLKDRMWDTHVYSEYEILDLMRPIMAGGLTLPNIQPSVPLWMVQMKKINSTEWCWREVEIAWKVKKIPLQVAQLWYILLNPFSPIPTYLQVNVLGKHQKLGCGCFACNVLAKNYKCAAYDDGGCCNHDLKAPEWEPCPVPLEAVLPVKRPDRMNRQTAKVVNKYFPFRTAVAGRRANIDVGSVVQAILRTSKCRKMWRLVRDTLLLRCGGSNNMVAALLLWLSSNTCTPTGHMTANSAGILGTCSKHWIQHFKEVHDTIRTAHAYDGIKLEPKDHSQLLYIHLLYGRTGKEVDWAKEKAKRTRVRKQLTAYDGKSWTRERWAQMLKAEIRNVVSAIKKTKPTLESFEQYWEARWAWMASGAATGHGKLLNKDECMQISKKEDLRSVPKGNKRSVSEKLGAEHFLKYMDREPRQIAYAHTKANELAKERAIYGVTMEHYVLQNYMLGYIDEGVCDKTMQIKENVSSEVKNTMERQRRCMQKASLNSFDFSDFNDQHELWVMSYLQQNLNMKIREWYGTSKNIDQANKIGDWLANSFLRQVYIDRETGEEVEVTGGLFSGVRATTLINTLLNKCYTNIVRKICSEIHGYDPVVESWHTGDDVVMVMRDNAANTTFNDIALKIGLEAQRSKLITDEGTLEYLRLMYYPDGSVLGSICRSIGSFVNGNWESDSDPSPLAKAQACWEQCATLLRRGVNEDMCNDLLFNLVRYYTRTKYIGSKEGLSKSIPIDFVSLTRREGGLGLGKLGNGTILQTGTSISTRAEQGRPEYDCIHSKLKAGHAYIKKLQRELPRGITIPKGKKRNLLNMLADSTAGLELPKGDKRTVNDVKVAARVRNFLTEHKPKIKEPDLKKKDIGTVLQASERIIRLKKRKAYYDKMKIFLPYLQEERPGLIRQMQERWTHGEHKDIARLEELTDRCDGGRVPPQLYSLIQDYCSIYNTETQNYTDSILSNELLSKWHY